MRKFIGIPGKGMIVCATRDICADLYEQIIALKPDWHSDPSTVGRSRSSIPAMPVIKGRRGSTSAGPRRTRRSSTVPRAIPRRGTGTRHRAIDVAHRVRLAAAAHAICRQADAGRGAHAGAGESQPHLPRQAGRAAGRVRPAGRESSRGDRGVHRPRPATKPLGHDLDEALAKVRELHDIVGNVILDGYDWRGALAAKSPRAYLNAILGALDYLRSPQTPGNEWTRASPPLLTDSARRPAARQVLRAVLHQH